MTGWTLRRWTSHAGNPIRAVELWPSPIAADSLAQALVAMSSWNLDDASFVVVGLSESVGLRDAIAAALARRLRARVCLAIGRSSMTELRGLTLDDDRIGVMLDNVDAETPMADLVCDSIEAVRFCPDFVRKAKHSMRHGLALDAILGLAGALGLATLGPVGVPNED